MQNEYKYIKELLETYLYVFSDAFRICKIYVYRCTLHIHILYF